MRLFPGIRYVGQSQIVVLIFTTGAPGSPPDSDIGSIDTNPILRNCLPACLENMQYLKYSRTNYLAQLSISRISSKGLCEIRSS